MAQDLLLQRSHETPLPSLSAAFRTPFLSTLPPSRTPAAAQYLSYLLALHLTHLRALIALEVSKVVKKPDWRRDAEMGVGGVKGLREGEWREIGEWREWEKVVERKLLEAVLDLALMKHDARE